MGEGAASDLRRVAQVAQIYLWVIIQIRKIRLHIGIQRCRVFRCDGQQVRRVVFCAPLG